MTVGLIGSNSVDSLAQVSPVGPNPNASWSERNSPSGSGAPLAKGGNFRFVVIETKDTQAGEEKRVSGFLSLPGTPSKQFTLDSGEKGLQTSEVAQEALALARKTQEQNLELRIEVVELRLRVEQQDAQIAALMKLVQELQPPRSANV